MFGNFLRAHQALGMLGILLSSHLIHLICAASPHCLPSLQPEALSHKLSQCVRIESFAMLIRSSPHH